MGRIHIGKSVYCDLSKLINTRLLIQANSGGGKSWLLRRLLEQSHGKVQQIVIDLEGEFATLREKYDYVLAGKEADIQIRAKDASLLARKTLEFGFSLILDLYELKQPQRIQYVRLFLEAIVDAPKKFWHPVLIIVDEAHQFAPQKSQSEATSAVIDLMTRGRKRGYCGILATQRISKLHKDACAEANNVLIGRTGLDIDRKRAADELGFMSKDQQLGLRSLKPGEFFAFGPAFNHDGIKAINVGDVDTTHPKAGARIGFITPKATSEVKKILKQLADLPQEAEKEARTLEDYKKQIAQLRREITLSNKAQPEPTRGQIDAAVRKAVAEKDREQDANLRKSKKYADGLFAVLKDVNQKTSSALDKFNVTPHEIRKRFDRPVTTKAIVRPPEIPTQSEFDGKPLVAGALRMLRVLVSRYPMVLTRSQLAMFAKLSPRSGTFGTYLSTLRSRQFLSEQNGEFQATDAGIDYLGETPSPPQTPDEVIAQWQDVLGGNNGARRMFDSLIDTYPDSLSREALGDVVGMSHTSGSFGTYLSTLRRNGLAEVSNGQIKASEDLYA